MIDFAQQPIVNDLLILKYIKKKKENINITYISFLS